MTVPTNVCPTCGGAGTIPGPAHDPYHSPCPDCGGTGCAVPQARLELPHTDDTPPCPRCGSQVYWWQVYGTCSDCAPPAKSAAERNAKRDDPLAEVREALDRHFRACSAVAGESALPDEWDENEEAAHALLAALDVAESQWRAERETHEAERGYYEKGWGETAKARDGWRNAAELLKRRWTDGRHVTQRELDLAGQVGATQAALFQARAERQAERERVREWRKRWGYILSQDGNQAGAELDAILGGDA